MTRFLRLDSLMIAICVIMMTMSGTAQAQIVSNDDWGYPLRTVYVNLTAGRTYSFSTQ